MLETHFQTNDQFRHLAAKVFPHPGTFNYKHYFNSSIFLHSNIRKYDCLFISGAEGDFVKATNKILFRLQTR